jgi:hypothetical protein
MFLSLKLLLSNNMAMQLEVRLFSDLHKLAWLERMRLALNESVIKQLKLAAKPAPR